METSKPLAMDRVTVFQTANPTASVLRPPTYVDVNPVWMGCEGFLANKENISPAGVVMNKSAVSNSQLPSWYPRVPLQDITFVMNSTQVGEMAVEKKEGKMMKDSGCRVYPRLDSQVLCNPVYCRLPNPSKANRAPISHLQKRPQFLLVLRSDRKSNTLLRFSLGFERQGYGRYQECLFMVNQSTLSFIMNIKQGIAPGTTVPLTL
eukprot:Gb_00938 [translate_table: standard]